MSPVGGISTPLICPIVIPPNETDAAETPCDDRSRIKQLQNSLGLLGNDLSHKGRPLPPAGGKFTWGRAARAAGIISMLSGATLLGYRLFATVPQYNGPETDIRGKTVLVTEASARQSRDLLQGLARRGAHLILACDNLEECANTRDKLVRATNISASRVDCRQLELDSTPSVRRLVASLSKDYPTLDRLIVQSPSCVTGVVAGKRRPTHDGFEQQLGTNYFSIFLLVRLLWGLLNQTPNSRLILVVDTDAAQSALSQATLQPGTDSVVQLPIEDLNFDDPNSFKPQLAYERSQWFLKMFADELTRQRANKGCSVLLVNPRITQYTAPMYAQKDGNSPRFTSLLYNLDNLSAKLIKRRTSSTALFCAIADQASLQLPTDNSAFMQAPTYQNLQLTTSTLNDTSHALATEEAARILWVLSQKWVRLDTHPDPVPLPKRVLANPDDSVAQFS